MTRPVITWTLSVLGATIAAVLGAYFWEVHLKPRTGVSPQADSATISDREAALTPKEKGAAPDRSLLESPRDRRDVRSRFGADSIRTYPRYAAIGDSWYSASVSFTLENQSGIGFDAMIRRGATSIGSCVGDEQRSSGLELGSQAGSYADREQSTFRYIAPNAKVFVTIVVGGCQAGGFSDGRPTDAAVTLIVKVGDDKFDVPVGVSGIPVRLGGFR
jgi:hypothetical protein